uniref:Uncharacterized protein n=1 Tax=Amphimedon queenslandica TaxID=400682 RepID=A0A1X7VR80_AMPQE
NVIRRMRTMINKNGGLSAKEMDMLLPLLSEFVEDHDEHNGDGESEDEDDIRARSIVSKEDDWFTAPTFMYSLKNEVKLCCNYEKTMFKVWQR